MTLQEKLNQKAEKHVHETGKESFFQELNDFLREEGFSKLNGLAWKLMSRDYEGFWASIKIESGVISHDSMFLKYRQYDTQVIRVSLTSCDWSWDTYQDFPLEGELVTVLVDIKKYLEEIVS